LRVLEFFDAIRRPAACGEIAAALGFPQSSASMLLRSMEVMGYLTHAPGKRSYVPTMRVGLLGTWSDAGLFRDGPIQRLVRDLTDRTGHAVVLAARCGTQARYILAEGCDAGPNIGQCRPLTLSASGHTMLSGCSDTEAERVIRRLNAEAPGPDAVVPPVEMLRALRGIRQRRFALARDRDAAGFGEIAIPFAQPAGQPPHAIGLWGEFAKLSAEAGSLGALLREAIGRHITDRASA